MHPSCCQITDQDSIASSISSVPSFFSFEEDHSSTLSLLCFDGGLFIDSDDILINYNDILVDYNDTMQAPTNSDEGLIFMPDYLWDNFWHPPIADDSTPIAHHDNDDLWDNFWHPPIFDEMADSHSMWDHWLNATCQPHPPHSSCCYDDSPSINGIPDHSSNTSMSPGNFTGGEAPGNPGTDKLNLQSSSYFEACSASAYASLHQIDMEDCNNALETREIEDTKELAVAIQVKCNSPLLDDGYIWRKYGQKNIKGKSFPRSYYRCAQPLCPIKKQTEGSSEMEGYVVMTYFGKHNHYQPD